jgi:hypothetical protein
MAVVRRFTVKDLDRQVTHTEVEATNSTVEVDGEKFVQIDTYGSKNRAIPNKVSQSLRLSKAAFDELVKIGSKFF